MHRRQERQEMGAPELGGAELPARTANGPRVPMFIDELVGNAWIEQVEQLAGAGDMQTFHGIGDYPIGNVPSGFCLNA
jgi:hypothetical protein